MYWRHESNYWGSKSTEIPPPGDPPKRKSKSKGRWMQGAVKRPGAFTAKAKEAGMGVQEYARHVLSGKTHASTRTKRQANLARTFNRYRPK